MKKLFSERQGGMKPRIKEELDHLTRQGLLTAVEAKIQEQWFGQSFPEPCGDGFPNAGCDRMKLSNKLNAFALINVAAPPDIAQILRDLENPPADAAVFDLIEFSYEYIALPIDLGYHSYLQHTHYKYDQAAGRVQFLEEVNRIFERNGMAFHLVDGQIERIAPAVLQETLAQTVFKTGDAILDELLETARQKFLNRDLAVRRESLEKLWDAWERLKTVEDGKCVFRRIPPLIPIESIHQFRGKASSVRSEATLEWL